MSDERIVVEMKLSQEDTGRLFLKAAKSRQEIKRLRAIIEEVNSWAVCAGIASPEDMAQNFPRIIEITDLGKELTECLTRA